jgi:thiamine biosynthesis lipoprotein ApbE
MVIKRILSFLLFCFLLLDLLGCEAFTRKFTRKTKKADTSVEMVLVPEEYKGPNMSKEDIYRQYYNYWSTWQDELINALTQNASQKKKIDCAQEALKNLIKIKMMVSDEAQKNFDPAIADLNNLLAYIKSDLYGQDDNRNRRVAEKIKTSIHDNLNYPEVKNYLK